MTIYDYAWFFYVWLCMAGTDIIGDNRLKIIHGRRKREKNFRLGFDVFCFIIMPCPSLSRLYIATKSKTSAKQLKSV